MKKKNTLTIFLLLICVALLGTGIVLTKMPVEKPEGGTGQNITLVNLGEGEITKLVLAHAEGTELVFLPASGGQYLLEEYLDFEQDTLRIKTLISSVQNIQTVQQVEEKSTRLGEFGLATPTLVVTIQTEAGREIELALGDPAPSGEGYYACFLGEDDVYLLANTAVVHWLYQPLEYINRTLGEMTMLTELTTAELVRDDLGALRFERTAEAGGIDTVTHRMTEPEEKVLDLQIFGAVVNSTTGLTAQSVATVNPGAAELKAVGLEDPHATFTIEANGKTNVYRAGQEQNGFVYLMKNDIPVLYIVSVDTIPWYTVSYGQLLSKELLSPAPEELSGIVLYDGEHEFAFQISGTSPENLTIIRQDKTIDRQLFLEYFYNIGAVVGEQYASDVPESFTGEPTWAVRYIFKDSKADAEDEPDYRRLRIFEGEDSKYYIYVDRSCDFTLSEKTVKQLVANTTMFFELAGLVEVAE